MSVATKEFRAKAGSSPATRFVLGAFVMIGALAFLGCPLRMVLRIGGGDLNAVVGLVGFTLGIFIGIQFLKRGFSLKRAYPVGKGEGGVLPIVMTGLLILVIAVPSLFKFSEEGPGSKHAPMLAALLIVVVVLAGNLITGSFKLGFELQPIAHSSQLWNLLGMVLVGWGSVLLGGCPLRQLILAGEGNGDSAVTVFGMIVGAAFAHNFGLAGNADAVNEAKEIVVGGLSNNGKAAVCLGILIMLGVSLWNIPKTASVPVEAAK